MQIGTVRVQPRLCASQMGVYLFDQPPEPARMIHLDQMRDFVRGKIFKDEIRRENQPPGIG